MIFASWFTHIVVTQNMFEFLHTDLSFSAPYNECSLSRVHLLEGKYLDYIILVVSFLTTWSGLLTSIFFKFEFHDYTSEIIKDGLSLAKRMHFYLSW